jgi:transketolase
MVFLTGDLGFMALEPLKDALGQRFINAGVAEQNMISVAAGLARQNLDVWVYSIAPFCYARPFEQIRNDIAFHNLPVKLIGNGGGYGYGVMGPTHHAIEDYGVMLSLPNMNALIPVFDEDLDGIITRAGELKSPSYIRIGRGEPPNGYEVPGYSRWRQLTRGKGAVVIVVGPLAGTYLEALAKLPGSTRPNLWVVTELPIDKNPPPSELIAQINISPSTCIVEEHAKHGGFGSDLLLFLAEKHIEIRDFKHLYARAHHYERYGSQHYLRKQSALDVESLFTALELN